MFNSQVEWVPVYFRDTFLVETSATQRSESMNALFKLWVNNHTYIYQFVLQIEKMIEDIFTYIYPLHIFTNLCYLFFFFSFV
jgi:hypothetical protein